jgi:phosphohistidine swiveling domain-containing protein
MSWSVSMHGRVVVSLTRYPDGRWWPNEHQVSERFPLVCRGNTGEVYPNVVAPLTGSILNVPFALGMRRAATELGFATPEQVEEFDGRTTAMTANFAGYLYGNVSLVRSVVARTPGLTIDDVDRQLFGLSDAPPHERGAGERSPGAALRALFALGRGLLRPHDHRLRACRSEAEAFADAAPVPAEASTPELLAFVRSADERLERSMHDLIVVGSFAGMSRSMLERTIADLDGDLGGDDLVNRLTSGLGTIESAEPPNDLWRLARSVAGTQAVSDAFDDRTHGLLERLGSEPDAAEFLEAFDAFRRRHGARGPDEWELRSPTWGSEPSIALNAIDRLRFAPPERDPVAVGAALATGRDARRVATQAALPRRKRAGFDIAMRGVARYEAQREGIKAAMVRLLYPLRLSLAELARRSGFSHDEAFLLTIDELTAALDDPEPFRGIVAERTVRLAYLQARVPPFWFQGEIPDPSTWELRDGLRRPDETAREITGIGVCSGTATGTARVVTDPADPGALEPGDILVAPITDPAWTPLFLAVAGVVVDVGAHLSHAAIVSRELGIPAVVSATGASSTIPDGARITVDGSRGVVIVHGHEAG